MRNKSNEKKCLTYEEQFQVLTKIKSGVQKKVILDEYEIQNKNFHSQFCLFIYIFTFQCAPFYWVAELDTASHFVS